MMKPFTLLLFGLSLLMFSSGCGSDGSRSYSGKHVELDFSGTGAIPGGSWIQIDGLRLEHFDRHEQLVSEPFALPATVVFHTIEAGDREGAEPQLLPEPFTRLDIAIRIGNFLNQNPGADFRYQNSSPHLMMLGSKVRIRRSDNEPISVQLSADYPITVSILE